MRSKKHDKGHAASTPRGGLDPLDLEIVEQALEGTFTAMRGKHALDFNDESLDDEVLEIALRRELIEIACWHGLSDPESLRDILLAHRSQA